MLKKLEGNLLLVSAMICIPLLLLQGIWLAPPSPPHTLLLVMITTIAGFAVLLWFTLGVHKAERRRLEQRWMQALQHRDPAKLDSPQAQAVLRQLLVSFNTSDMDARRQISELHHQAHLDELTRLRNRHGFQRDMSVFLQQEETHSAFLILIRASKLATINDQRGALAGDTYLKELTELISQVVSHIPGHQIYRISGADFAVLLQPADDIQPHLLGQGLKLAFDQYQQQHGLAGTAYSGLTPLSSGQKIEAILARADLALARAQTGITNGWAIQQYDSSLDLHGQQHWKKVLDELLEQERVSFHSQPIQVLNQDIVPYQEIYARFNSGEGTVLPMDTLFAMAQRLDMVMRLEQMLIRHLMRQHRAFGSHHGRWGLRLSGSALQNSTFLIWLDQQLSKDPDTAAHLVFELNEEQLERNPTAAKRLFDQLRRQGSRSAICNFGKGIDSFALLRELKPDYVKLDSALITALEQDPANQQFVQMVVDVSHRMGCLVIAEGVEEPDQKQLLQGMYVDGLQGYLIARPQELRPDIPLQGPFTGGASTSAGSI
jgi:RNase E specificity factor CsrD